MKMSSFACSMRCLACSPSFLDCSLSCLDCSRYLVCLLFSALSKFLRLLVDNLRLLAKCLIELNKRLFGGAVLLVCLGFKCIPTGSGKSGGQGGASLPFCPVQRCNPGIELEISSVSTSARCSPTIPESSSAPPSCLSYRTSASLNGIIRIRMKRVQPITATSWSRMLGTSKCSQPFFIATFVEVFETRKRM